MSFVRSTPFDETEEEESKDSHDDFAAYNNVEDGDIN